MLVRVADHADNDGVCWPGNDSIAHFTCMHESTVRRNLKRLEDRELLRRERRLPKSGRGRATDTICLRLDQPGESPAKSLDDQPGVEARPTGRLTPDQPGDQPSPMYEEPKGTPRNPKNARKATDPGAEWQEWLADYRQVTGRQARGSETARIAFAARRREGWSLEDLELATRGCHADKWKRDRAHDVPDTILRASHVEPYFLAGQALERKASKVTASAEAEALTRRIMAKVG